jgi:hypothetical protein
MPKSLCVYTPMPLPGAAGYCAPASPRFCLWKSQLPGQLKLRPWRHPVRGGIRPRWRLQPQRQSDLAAGWASSN